MAGEVSFPSLRQDVPRQPHLDLTVSSRSELDSQHRRAIWPGATVLLDDSQAEVEPLPVYADPAGHPFRVFAAGQ